MSIIKLPRHNYLDIAKALTIFLVIIGHAAGNFDTPLYRVILYTFHMPLFFIVSGIVIRHNCSDKYGWNHWINFIHKNILALVVPYFIWALIYSNFNYTHIPNIIYGSWEKIESAETLTSLWFLPCLFTARIMSEIVLISSKLFPKCNKHLYALIMAFPSFTIGFLLPKIQIGYPWCMNIAFVTLGFMLLGYAAKKLFIYLHNKKWITLSLFFISVSLFILSILLQKNGPTLMRMCASEYGNPIFFFTNSIFGSCAILFFSIFLAKVYDKHHTKIFQPILWIGQNTMGIFLLHKPFLQQVILPLLSKIGISTPNVPAFILAFIGALITLPFSCLATRVINRYIPELFGKFPNVKNKTT